MNPISSGGHVCGRRVTAAYSDVAFAPLDVRVRSPAAASAAFASSAAWSSVDIFAMSCRYFSIIAIVPLIRGAFGQRPPPPRLHVHSAKPFSSVQLLSGESIS